MFENKIKPSFSYVDKTGGEKMADKFSRERNPNVFAMTFRSLRMELVFAAVTREHGSFEAVKCEAVLSVRCHSLSFLVERAKPPVTFEAVSTCEEVPLVAEVVVQLEAVLDVNAEHCICANAEHRDVIEVRLENPGKTLGNGSLNKKVERVRSYLVHLGWDEERSGRCQHVPDTPSGVARVNPARSNNN